MSHPFILAITGASGAVYATRLLEVMLRAGHTVHVTLSPSGAAVLTQELGLRVDLARFRPGMLLASEADPPGESSTAASCCITTTRIFSPPWPAARFSLPAW